MFCQISSVEMVDEFYKKHNLKKSGEGPGGKFNGPSIKYFLQERVLNDLETKLPTYSIAVDFTTYFRSIRDLHKACTAQTLENRDTNAHAEELAKPFFV